MQNKYREGAITCRHVILMIMIIAWSTLVVARATTETICLDQSGSKKMFAMYVQRQSSIDNCKTTIDVRRPCALTGGSWPGPLTGITSQKG